MCPFKFSKNFLIKTTKMNGHSPNKLSSTCHICEKFQLLLMHPININPIPHESFPHFDSPESMKIIRNFIPNNRIIFIELDPATQLLKETIEALSKKYHKTPEEIISVCEKVSGGISDVEEYLQEDDTKREVLIWTPEDDEVLERVKSEHDHVFKLLMRYKGREKIRKRLAFKSIVLPFEF